MNFTNISFTDFLKNQLRANNLLKLLHDQTHNAYSKFQVQYPSRAVACDNVDQLMDLKIELKVVQKYMLQTSTCESEKVEILTQCSELYIFMTGLLVRLAKDKAVKKEIDEVDEDDTEYDTEVDEETDVDDTLAEATNELDKLAEKERKEKEAVRRKHEADNTCLLKLEDKLEIEKQVEQ